MNIFEVFGFFIMGSIFNMLLVTLFVMIIINRVKSGLNNNIQNLFEGLKKSISDLNNLVLLFKKGDNNESNTDNRTK